LWLDCDREGENICFEVIQNTKRNMTKMNEQQIFRARFSAITATDIQRAMNNLVYPNENEALSVDARQELDLKIGVAFTRFQTKYFQGKYGNLDASLVSFGPCQTPTLGFCVKRHDDIVTFQPEPFWSIEIILQNMSDFTLSWGRGNVFDHEVTSMFEKLIRESKTLRCVSVTKEEKKKQRPQPLNTVEMLKVASTGLGMGPHHSKLILHI